MTAPTPAMTPGLLVLQGNRLEWLLEAVLEWLQAHPLAPLETETLLVQSNGIAEWLKMSLAERAGVCAATRVELPARFLWRLYRSVLGRGGAPARSAMDEAPLTWRLMRLLPRLIGQVGYEPLAQFLDAGASGPAGSPDPAQVLPRRLELARRLADLYDQYQVYRADWLHAWMQGDEVLIGPAGRRSALPDEQCWQARLWRALCEELGEAERAGVRGEVHARAMQVLDAGRAVALPLPRRVVVFGISHLPQQTLEGLAALSRHAQVLLAVPNPCRYHWGDIIEGRELLRRPGRLRQSHRRGIDLAQLPLEAAHAQAHPLLAAWGRQARDFLSLLEQFDETQAVARAMQLPRVDLFDESPGTSRLAQLQARIRDNLPPGEALEGAAPPPPGDRSIVFHIAHSAMREVEILHDQLLALLHGAPADAATEPVPTEPGPVAEGRPLMPRDIVVMLPDIEPWAPLIHAVFGRHAPGDPRRIPYEISDLRARSQAPLLHALEWLLRVDEHRFTAGELRDLLEVPALARRFGLDDEGREVAARWLAGSGVRWGLHASQREALGLAACGEANTWRFGMRRMLLGYAVGAVDEEAAETAQPGRGDAPGWQGIAAYDEVGGLEAVVAGSLAALYDALDRWWALAREPVPPAEWGLRARALLQAFFDPADEADRVRLGALHEALGRWQEDCEAAGFAEVVPLAVLREAWLAGVDEPALRSRFLSGGVLFCTLMPMRAIPFEVIALLGMNEGDYPRRSPRSDFDLIAAPGQRRPGDRARRDDDRLLMLEALLSARRVLYVSWSGRSVRDNTAQPPSVLVAQLRDTVAATWGEAELARLTTEHPLQPFSRRYFEAAAPPVEAAAPPGTPAASVTAAAPGPAAPALFTYAHEWRRLHESEAGAASPGRESEAAPSEPAWPAAAAAPEVLDLKRLATWLRRPVATHWRERLGVVFTPLDAALSDDEPMGLDALQETVLLRSLTADLSGCGSLDDAALQTRLERRIERLARRGELPLGALGRRWQDHFRDQARPMLQQWLAWQAEFAVPVGPQRFQWPRPTGAGDAAEAAAARPAGPGELRLDDWIDGLRCAAGPAAGPAADAAAPPMFLVIDARRLTHRQGADLQALPDKLIEPWLTFTVAAACGVALRGRIVGRDAVLSLASPPMATAQAWLAQLLETWQACRKAPPPAALRTALAWLQAGSPDQAEAAARTAYDGSGLADRPGEGDDAALARLWPNWEALAAEPAPTEPGAGPGSEVGRDPGERAPGFAHWARRLYEPLRQWTADCVQAQPLGGAPAHTDPMEQTDDDGGERAG